jgi:hypothetical protein
VILGFISDGCSAAFTADFVIEILSLFIAALLPQSLADPLVLSLPMPLSLLCCARASMSCRVFSDSLF